MRIFKNLSLSFLVLFFFSFIFIHNSYASGNISSWNSTTSLPQVTEYATSVEYNGYVYEIGGVVAGHVRHAVLATVYYAHINSKGTLGSWTATTSLPVTTQDATSVVYNGYVYEIGGDNGNTFSTVYYAHINSNGTLSSWLSTTSLPVATFMATSVVYNGYIYEIGGYSGRYYSSVAVATVYYTHINSNGTLGSWLSTTSLPVATDQAKSVVYKGYVYEIGGYNGSTGLATVYYAHINSNGTLGTWSATTSLQATASSTSVAYNGYIYNLGGYYGYNGITFVATVYYAHINSNGTLGSWMATTSLPVTIQDATSVLYKGYVYEIGGEDNGGTLATVYYARLQTNNSHNSSRTSIVPLGSDGYQPGKSFYDIGGKTVLYMGIAYLKNVSYLNGQEIMHLDGYDWPGGQYVLCNNIQYYYMDTMGVANNSGINLHKTAKFISTLPALSSFSIYKYKSSSCISDITFVQTWRQAVVDPNREYNIKLMSGTNLINGNNNQIVIKVMEGNKPLLQHKISVHLIDYVAPTYGTPVPLGHDYQEIRTNNKGIATFTYKGLEANLNPVSLRVMVADELGGESFSPSSANTDPSKAIVFNEYYPNNYVPLVFIFLITIVFLIFKLYHPKKKNINNTIITDSENTKFNTDKIRSTSVLVITIFMILYSTAITAFLLPQLSLSLLIENSLISEILTLISISIVLIIFIISIVTAFGLIRMAKWGVYLFIILGIINIIYLISTNFYPNIFLNLNSDFGILIYLIIFFYFLITIRKFD